MAGMPKRRARRRTIQLKKDANHPEIVQALRKLGFTVHETHEVAHGFPDIVVGLGGMNLLVEIKNPAYKSKLTPDQVRWHAAWGGQVMVARSTSEVLSLGRAQLGRLSSELNELIEQFDAMIEETDGRESRPDARSPEGRGGVDPLPAGGVGWPEVLGQELPGAGVGGEPDVPGMERGVLQEDPD